jgi:hypothetical protein
MSATLSIARSYILPKSKSSQAAAIAERLRRLKAFFSKIVSRISSSAKSTKISTLSKKSFISC